METQREKILKALGERFSTFSNFVTIQNKAGFYDINKSAERLFIDVLNIVFKVSLRDMNEIQDNYPAIDLGDYNTRTCIQVTSESTNQKFRSTIKKFKENQLDRDFDKLIFLIISNRDKCSITDQLIDTKVINLNDLYQMISTLEDRDILYINDYLARNLLSRVEQNDSILPSSLNTTYAIPRPNAFISFLGIDDEPEDIDLLLKDIKSLAQILSNLTQHQKEFLFYIVAHGQFVRDDRIFMPTSEVEQRFGEYSVKLYEVLRAKGLIFIDEEYDLYGDDRYISALVPWFRGEFGENLFPLIKSFCKENSYMLEGIIVNCDFSQLK